MVTESGRKKYRIFEKRIFHFMLKVKFFSLISLFWRQFQGQRKFQHSQHKNHSTSDTQGVEDDGNWILLEENAKCHGLWKFVSQSFWSWRRKECEGGHLTERTHKMEQGVELNHAQIKVEVLCNVERWKKKSYRSRFSQSRTKNQCGWKAECWGLSKWI